MADTDIPALRTTLLDWYDRHARPLPWRTAPADRAKGIRPDPYRVWLSEIMLQQTTVAAVGGYFARFLAAFPTVEELAAAPSERVMELWAGLGYYARARNLHACAKAVVARGGFPDTVDGLLALPGIGPYTAAAVAAIAFDTAVTPADGNVERVLARLWQIADALPAAKPVFRAAAARFDDPHRPGDFAQALMDLGATVCTPRSSACAICPWMEPCAARRAGEPQRYPVKSARPERPVRYGTAFALHDGVDLLVRRRAPKGLLGGMLELPGTPWRTGNRWSEAEALAHAPAASGATAPVWTAAGSITHIFTHFTLELELLSACAPLPEQSERVALSGLDAAGLPSVMLKAARLVQAA
jgi:A/G-specific adenine glycosylase